MCDLPLCTDRTYALLHFHALYMTLVDQRRVRRGEAPFLMQPTLAMALLPETPGYHLYT